MSCPRSHPIHPPSPFLPSPPKTIYQSQSLIHPYIFSQHSKDVEIRLCIFTFTFVSSLPCLCLPLLLYHPYLVCVYLHFCIIPTLFVFTFTFVSSLPCLCLPSLLYHPYLVCVYLYFCIIPTLFVFTFTFVSSLPCLCYFLACYPLHLFSDFSFLVAE